MEAPFLINHKDTQYPSAAELVAIGRIDSIDLSTNTLTVEGQVAAISESTQLIDALHGTSHLLIATANTKQHLNVGDHVAIAGDVTGPGQAIARFVVLMTSPATPGTSLVYVRGVVDEIDPIGREISIGQLRLNLNVSGNLNNSDNILVGDIIEAVGYSIGSGKLAVTDCAPIKSSEIESAETSTPQGIHGSGLKGIHGSGLKGIHGSGLKGIHGSGLKGIHGSGLKGIHGSGLKGIHGSGLKGIHGSGLKGIHGSGLKGIHGSGLKGIHGSGLKGIHGSGLKGIQGSGLKGIHGSGLKGIHGSGLKGIHGSGLKGIHGSGLKGIHGSGLKGIHGSGLKGIAPSESST
jgi:hypothetical protein